MHKIKMGLATLAIAGMAVLGVALPAQATGNNEGDCVPAAAYTETVPGTPAVDAVYDTVVVSEAGWQRYSWNGPWESNTEAPPFPDSHWQANTKSDPHGVGVAGAYFRSHGNSGNGDWFYLEAVPEVTKQVLVTAAVPAGEPTVIEHPAVTCEPPVVIPNSISTSHTVGCVDDIATVTITLRNISPWIYPTSVEIDGIHSYGPTVDNRTDGKLNGAQKDASVTRVITFTEDSGEHVVRYRVDAGSENSLYKNLPVGEWTTVSVDTNCITDTVVTPPEDTQLPTVDNKQLAFTGPNDAMPWMAGLAGLLMLGGILLKRKFA